MVFVQCEIALGDPLFSGNKRQRDNSQLDDWVPHDRPLLGDSAACSGLELRNAYTALPNSLDFRGEGYLVRRGTLCEHRTRRKHCREKSAKDAIYFAVRRIIALYIGRSIFCLAHPHRRLEHFPPFKAPDTRYASSFRNARF